MTGSVGKSSPERQFGAAVRRAREQRGWSQEGLASLLQKHLEISVGGQSGVARIERAERPTRLNEVTAIAAYLGIDLSSIFTPEFSLETDEEVQEAIDALADLDRELGGFVEVKLQLAAAVQIADERISAVEAKKISLHRALTWASQNNDLAAQWSVAAGYAGNAEGEVQANGDR